MRRQIIGLNTALHVAALGLVGLAASLNALAQDAAPKSPDGGQAQSILQLVPRHATLSVADLKAETNWYIEKFGFAVLPSPQPNPGGQGGPGGPARATGAGGPGGQGGPGGMGGKMQGVQLGIPGFQMHLIQYQGSERAKTPSPEFLAQGWIHVAFTVVDLDKAYAFLQGAGVDVKGNRDKNGKMGTLVVHDPEGNAFELFSR